MDPGFVVLESLYSVLLLFFCFLFFLVVPGLCCGSPAP